MDGTHPQLQLLLICLIQTGAECHDSLFIKINMYSFIIKIIEPLTYGRELKVCYVCPVTILFEKLYNLHFLKKQTRASHMNTLCEYLG